MGINQYERFNEIMDRLDARLDAISNTLKAADRKVILEYEEADYFCKNFCKYPALYGWTDKGQHIAGIERHCENCPLVKGVKNATD